MMRVDHIGLSAHDAHASAQALAAILGAPEPQVDGAEGDMYRVDPRMPRRIAFGNDPEAPQNGRTDDPLGGAGRVYFVDANGHLFEVTS